MRAAQRSRQWTKGPSGQENKALREVMHCSMYAALFRSYKTGDRTTESVRTGEVLLICRLFADVAGTCALRQRRISSQLRVSPKLRARERTRSPGNERGLPAGRSPCGRHTWDSLTTRPASMRADRAGVAVQTQARTAPSDNLRPWPPKRCVLPSSAGTGRRRKITGEVTPARHRRFKRTA